MKEFQKEYGHTIPPAKFGGLKKWCERQRTLQRKGKLSQERFNLLESIEFDWDPLETEWQKKFFDLKAFQKEYGNLNPPSSYGGGLAKWCTRQRELKKKGELLKKRFDLLESIGFIWNLKI